MPSREEIISFTDPPAPPGESALVPSATPSYDVAISEPDPRWPDVYASLEAQIRSALGFRALQVTHVGSTAVPGLPAKPVIDVDLVVADPDDEGAYVPALVAAGFTLRIREPWWYRHRMLRHEAPACNLHVFGFDSPEIIKHRIFRDWLRSDSADRELYASTKRAAASAATDAGDDVMGYNSRKEAVVREIYLRAFAAAGLV